MRLLSGGQSGRQTGGAILLQENCTVTMAHSRTRDLADLCRTADILVAAVGIPEMVEWIGRWGCVIDAGINRIDAPERGEGKTRLVGDVDFEAVLKLQGISRLFLAGSGR